VLEELLASAASPNGTLNEAPLATITGSNTGLSTAGAVTSGCNSCGIPVDSLRAMPGLASPDVWKSKLMVTGTNHDALYTMVCIFMHGISRLHCE
jgi:hypothetical protein